MRAQIGTEFSQSFEQYGKYRVEGYGKPKSPDFEKGKYDKCDPSCSIDIEVIENVLYDLECVTDIFSNHLDKNKKLKFRKNFPVSFNAKFHLPRSTEEKARLKMRVLDALGNVLTDTVVQGATLTFKPANSNAVYTIVAEYTTESGEVIIKEITGETESNTVVGISHSAEVVRPGTSLTFEVKKMRYDFINNDPEYDITPNEINEIKWNLNGIQIGTGRSITIPGNMLLTPQKYVIEAFCKMANAFGSKAKHEEDDWHFEVKHNDVVSFSLSGIPKVGKPVTVKVDKMIFPDLLNETIYWQAPFMNGTGQSISTTPRVAGTFPVKCSINNRKGISQNVTVVEAKIAEGFWNDFGGSEISRARWGQTIDYCIKGENIEGEKIELHIYDDDNPPNDDDFAYSNTENNKIIVGTNNKGYTFHSIELNDTIKDRTTNITSNEVKLYAKAKLIGFDTSLTDVTEKKDTQKHLTVNNEEEVYRAIIGDKDGRARHNPVDYDIISWVYANTTYPKGTKLKVKIFENTPWYEFDQKCDELEVTGTVEEDGTLVTEVNWGKLKDAKQNKKTKNYYAKIYNEDDDELLDGKDSDILCSTVLTPQSDLLKEASYVGAVTVGSQQVQNSGESCGGKFCIKKGSPKSELIREINIRLAGFGGNVPTDEFTDNTEKMIKQFQRDYMKIPETGKVCGNVLKAIDEFCIKYIEQINDYKCPCQNPNNSSEREKAALSNRCPDGWGKGLYSDQYLKSNITEAHRKYEYPGMHRSTLWAVSAMKFYLDFTKSVYSKYDVNRGYRCWADNNFHSRSSTNHFGKAADIRFNKNGERTRLVSDANKIRTDIFNKYLNAKWWGNPNFFTLEKESDGAVTYVHVDCRDFNIEYLENKFFIKTQENVMGKSIVQLANDLVFNNMCSCSGGFSSNSNNEVTSGDRVDPKTLKTSEKGFYKRLRKIPS